MAEKESNRFWSVDPESYRYYHKNLRAASFRFKMVDSYLSLRPFIFWRRYQPEVTLLAGAWHYPAYLLIGIWARLAGRRVIFWCEANRFSDKSHGWIANALRGWTYRLFGEFAVPGLESERYLHRFFKQPRVVLLPNSIAADFYEKPVQITRDLVLRQRFRFLFVGELSERKGVVEMVQAFLEASRTGDLHPDAQLDICGDGPLRDEIAQLSANCPGIRMHGFVNAGELHRFWGENGVLILNTKLDPNPLVVNEACAAGLLPIVSSRAGNSAELLEAGIDEELVCDPSQFRSALQYYCKIPVERLIELRMTALRHGANFRAEEVADYFVRQLFEEIQ